METDARRTQTDHGESQQHFPVGCRGLVASCAHDAQSQLRKVVSDAGYDIRYLSYYNFLLFPPILAARLVQRLTGLHTEDHGLGLPSRPVNWVLRKTFSAERFLLGRASLPVGVSLILLARNVSPQAFRGRDDTRAPVAQDRAIASA